MSSETKELWNTNRVKKHRSYTWGNRAEKLVTVKRSNIWLGTVAMPIIPDLVRLRQTHAHKREGNGQGKGAKTSAKGPNSICTELIPGRLAI